MIGVGHALNLVTSIGLAQIKALLNEGTDSVLREALAAFAQRREPSFTGRWALSRSVEDNRSQDA
jgi:hypothetical protein